MRKLVSAFLVVMVLFNVAAWPSAALAEVIDHDREMSLDSGSGRAPAEPAAHCTHGCVGHYSQHFQWQAPAPVAALCVLGSELVAARPAAYPPAPVPSLPFRPPLAASVLS